MSSMTFVGLPVLVIAFMRVNLTWLLKVMIVLGKVATAWYWIWVLCYSYLGVGCMVCLL